MAKQKSLPGLLVRGRDLGKDVHVDAGRHGPHLKRVVELPCLEEVTVKTCGWGGDAASRCAAPASLEARLLHSAHRTAQEKSTAVMPSGCPGGHSTNSIW